jgi:hypothetical protein
MRYDPCRWSVATRPGNDTGRDPLIVKRREKLTESERGDLTRMLEYLPELSTLRRFADRIYWLFDTPKDLHQASCRRAVIVRDPAFQAVPELVKAMEQLDEIWSDWSPPKVEATPRSTVGHAERQGSNLPSPTLGAASEAFARQQCLTLRIRCRAGHQGVGPGHTGRTARSIASVGQARSL